MLRAIGDLICSLNGLSERQPLVGLHDLSEMLVVQKKKKKNMSVFFPLQKRAYKSYAKALPGLKKIGISSVLLRKIIGSLEVGCGVVLTLVPGRPKDVANFLLLLVMLAVLFFHQLVGDPLKRYAHALVFGILLTCRLLIARQSDDRPEREDSREEQHMNDQEKNKVKQS